VTKSKFTDAQIAFILQQADERIAVAEICRLNYLPKVAVPGIQRDTSCGGWYDEIETHFKNAD
jgi:hypothetical protein